MVLLLGSLRGADPSLVPCIWTESGCLNACLTEYPWVVAAVSSCTLADSISVRLGVEFMKYVITRRVH